MKRIVAVAISCALAAGALGAPPAGFKSKWADAEKAARAANKPIFIHFVVDCIEDQQMQKRVLSTPEVQKALADFVPLCLDCTTKPRVEPAPAVKAAIERFRAYGGDNHPFFAVVTPDGDFLHAIRGFIPPESMIVQLDMAKAARIEYDEFQTYASKADKDAPEFKIRQLKFFVKFRKFPEAAALVESMLRSDPDGTRGLWGEAKLAQIAMAPPGEGPNATQAIYDELKQLDPRNEKGLWERAVLVQGERHYRSALRSEDEIEFRGKLVRPTRMIEDLLSNAARIDDRRAVYQMALFLYTSQQNFEKASGVIAELLKTASSEEAASLRKLDDEMKIRASMTQDATTPGPTRR